MSKNILRIIGFFAVGMLGGIFAEQVLWPYFVERPFFEKYGLSQPPVYVTEKKEITIQENTALTDAIEKVGKTVVGVRTKTSDGKIIEGSGLIVTSDGLMVTLAELVPKGSAFQFFIENKLVSYQILKRDLRENLALIKIGGANLPTTGFADLAKIKMGERVFLVGGIFKSSASSTKETFLKTANEGIIKNFDENSIETNISEKNTLAGSALFDIQGQVLGLNKVNSEGNIITLPISKIKTFIGM